MRKDYRTELLLWDGHQNIDLFCAENYAEGNLLRYTESNRKVIPTAYMRVYVYYTGMNPTRIEASASTGVDIAQHASWPRTVRDSLINPSSAHVRYTQDPH